MDPIYIRNFCIIAHVDHGKSTLADRLIESTNTISSREMKNQILDTMDIERERGITIKSQTICLKYIAKNNKIYYLNMIDTPGHVDFSYEVSRSLAACEIALLVIDASQGVQAQTIANMYQAIEQDLEIIPVINKIDLPTANIEKVKKQIEEDLGLNPNHTISISAKNNIGIDDLLESIVQYGPSPIDKIKDTLSNSNPAKALIFDAYFDFFKGIIITIRILDGNLNLGDEIIFFKTKKVYKIEEIGIHKIKHIPKKSLTIGEVGYLICNAKTISDVKIGDTITKKNFPCENPFPGYKDILPMIFCGLYLIDSNDFPLLQKSIEKLKLSDSSLVYEKESSIALGFGYRCGFLGLLHMEITQERLRREFNIELITTIPSVKYKIKYQNQEKIQIIFNPSNFPDKNLIDYTQEPYAHLDIITPDEYLGKVITLCHEKRGIQKNITYLDKKRVQVDFEIPLSEIIYEMHDKIKSLTRGYASYNYYLLDYRNSDLTRMDILVNGKRIDAFSHILHKSKVEEKGRNIIENLKELIPKHLFQISLQAAIGGKIIARENIRALRKNVTAKCYGGDITRKRKLLERQKEGKKKMKQFGSVEIPQEAFLSIFKMTST